MGRYSHGLMSTLEFTQGSSLIPLLFLIYIRDLVDDLSSNVKLFADDTCLLSVTHDVTTSAEELNAGLAKFNDRASQWKTIYNPGSSKQAQEVFFTRKQKNRIHLPLFFNNSDIYQTTFKKRLRVILDARLTLSTFFFFLLFMLSVTTKFVKNSHL